MGGRIFSSCGIIEQNSKANKLTCRKWTQVSQALVVQKQFIRFHLNFKTIILAFPLFLVVLDLTRREFDATLHADKSLKTEAKLGDRRN